jgi:hypothetical protein
MSPRATTPICGAALNNLKAAVQARQIPLEELRGATITLSNYGVSGAGRFANLVVVPPQVAIVGADVIKPRPCAQRRARGAPHAAAVADLRSPRRDRHRSRRASSKRCSSRWKARRNPHLSCPRRRASSDILVTNWIPALAGMTVGLNATDSGAGGTREHEVTCHKSQCRSRRGVFRHLRRHLCRECRRPGDLSYRAPPLDAEYGFSLAQGGFPRDGLSPRLGIGGVVTGYLLDHVSRKAAIDRRHRRLFGVHNSHYGVVRLFSTWARTAS